jgi:hypothetical protein
VSDRRWARYDGTIIHDHDDRGGDVDERDADVSEHVLEDPQREGLVATLTVNVVTTISSKLRAKASRPPASTERHQASGRRDVPERLELVGPEVGGRLVEVRRELAHAARPRC